MDFIPNHISKYAENHTAEASELLRKIERETHLQVMEPRMLSGHLQGRLLSLFSHMTRPSRILEIGTYTGYSAICMLEGLQPDGIIYTLDINEELESRVKGYFEATGKRDRFRFMIGQAEEIIPTLDETWDLVFIDADKINYSLYFDMVIEHVKPAGYIIADNALWSGQVTDPSAKDEDTEALRRFNRKIQQDERIENLLLPIRDGLMITRKR